MIEEYLNHFTKELSEEIKTYAVEEALKYSRYIFTERKGNQQWGYCTHCGKKFKTDGLRHKDEYECPHCNSECKVRASGMGRKYMYDDAYFVYYEKSIIDPQTIVARGIYVSRDYSGDYKDIRTKYYIRAMYVFTIGNSVMLQVPYWTEGIEHFYKTSTVHSLESNWSNMSYVKISYPKESIREAIKDTPFQYSLYEKYNYGGKSDMVKYFALYSKYPLIEHLIKLGFEEVIRAKLYGWPTYSSINWNGKNVYKMLRLNKGQVKEIRSSGKGIDTLFLRLYQMSIKDKSNLDIKEIHKISESYGIYYKDLQSILKYTTLKKANDYLKKQFKENPSDAFYRRSQELSTWKDYIKDCLYLKFDLKDKSVLFPKDLYTAHQNTIKQVKYKVDEELNRKMEERVREVNSRFYFEFNGLVIRAAASSNELIQEGKILHHCVGGYSKNYADGKTNIVLIRKLSDIDTPYYTVEIDNKNNIIQVRGKKNCSPNEEVSSFMNEFKKQKLSKRKTKIKIPA